MVGLKGILTATLLLGCALAGRPASSAWKTFRSASGFSAVYPASWFRQEISPDRLDILSSRGHAEISVAQETDTAPRTLDKVIDRYEHRGRVLLRRKVPAGRRGGCERLEEVLLKEPPVLPQDVPAYMRPRITDFIYTGLFCRIENRNFVVMLKNWEGDKRQHQYQHIALHIARSIRIVQ